MVVKYTKEGNFLSISNENGDITICINISEIRVLLPSEFLIFGMYGCKGRTHLVVAHGAITGKKAERLMLQLPAQ